ncbi:MAG: OmpH family outer membrane protein [Dokdonella sp.]
MAWSRPSEWPIRTLLLVLVLAACESLAQSPPAAAKIGYVDMKRLLDSAPQMAEGRRQLEVEFAARDASLQADEKQLLERRTAYEREAATLTTAQADAQKREIDALDRAIKRNRDNLRGELKTRSDQVLDGSWREINNVVVEFARDQNYDLIVQSPVIYANPRVDVTESVLERLRKEHRSAKP